MLVQEITVAIARFYKLTGKRPQEVLLGGGAEAFLRAEFKRNSPFPDDIPDDVQLKVDDVPVRTGHDQGGRWMLLVMVDTKKRGELEFFAGVRLGVPFSDAAVQAAIRPAARGG